MRSAIRLFLLALAALAVAYATQKLFFADVLPVSWQQEPQATWRLEAAFLLQASENIALLVMAITAAVAALSWWRKN